MTKRSLVLFFLFGLSLASVMCDRKGRHGGPLFAEPSGSPFPVGSSPNALAVGDFNEDGKPDLAVPNAGDNNVTVLLGDGNGGFTKAPGSPFLVGSGPSAVVVGDFNGDAKLDLGISNEVSNTVTILIGNGKGAFIAAHGSPFKVGARKWWLGGPSWPASLAVGDFNGDGKLDLAIAVVKDNIVIVLLGNGAGGFAVAPRSPVSVGSNPWSVAVGEFNGDGKPDLAITNAGDNNISVLLGNGMGGFTEALGSPFLVGKYPRSVTVSDFDGNGTPDLAIVNAKSENVTVLLGNGTGGFVETPGSPFSLGSVLNPFTHGVWPFCVAVGDFNRDGKPDLAIANTNNNVTVLLGNGIGGFAEAPDSPFRVGSLPKWVVAADFNADGRPDLATANRNDSNVTVLLNSYSGSVTPIPSATTQRLIPIAPNP